MNVLDLFSGIGGFSLGLERAGMRTVAFCETDEYCRRVLAKHWPDVPLHGDIKELKGDGIAADLVCGGPPCQHTSVAAAIQGQRDGRTLWPEMFKIIQAIQPRWAIVEQPPGNKEWEAAVQGDLETAGYSVSRQERSASGVGAPHLRRRVFFIANNYGARLALARTAGSPAIESQQGLANKRNSWLSRLSGVLRVDDGVPRGLDKSRRATRIHALGNAVVPQVVEMIGRAIMEADEINSALAKGREDAA